MIELLFCIQPLTSELLQTLHQLEMSNLFGLTDSKPSITKPYTPYIIENTLKDIDRGTYKQLSTCPIHKQRN